MKNNNLLHKEKLVLGSSDQSNFPSIAMVTLVTINSPE